MPQKNFDVLTPFQLGNRVIDLSKVVAFMEAPKPSDAPARDVSLMVHMVDGSNTVVYGGSDARAFARAMDSYLGVNLA